MMERVDIILLCGGQGTRFWPITHDEIPKPLYRLNGSELIEYSVSTIDLSLVNNLIFAVDHHADHLKKWIKGRQFSCNTIVSTQTEPGVYGAVQAAVKLVETGSFIVCNTDEVREGLNMQEFLMHHTKPGSHLATIAVTGANKLYRHRIMNIDEDDIVVSSEHRNLEYQSRPTVIKDVNAGFALFDKEAINYFDGGYGNDWSAMVDPLIERQLVKAFIDRKVVYFNVGTLEELVEAKEYFAQKQLMPL